MFTIIIILYLLVVYLTCHNDYVNFCVNIVQIPCFRYHVNLPIIYLVAALYYCINEPFIGLSINYTHFYLFYFPPMSQQKQEHYVFGEDTIINCTQPKIYTGITCVCLPLTCPEVQKCHHLSGKCCGCLLFFYMNLISIVICSNIPRITSLCFPSYLSTEAGASSFW